MRARHNNSNIGDLSAQGRGSTWMKTGTLLRGLAALALLNVAPPAWPAPVAVDTTSPANGFTDLFSATFDGALTPCTGGDPSWCSFFNGKPGPARNIVITPTPTGAVNAVPLGITPVPVSGSYLDLALNGARTQLTIAGGTIAVAGISLTIQGGTPNSTVVTASSAGVVFSAAPQVAAVDANGRAEFLVNLAPAIAVDFSTFSIITAPPSGSCSGPLCAIIPILTLDMVRYRLIVDYDENFETFTAGFIGQTGNNSILSIQMNSVVPEIDVATSVAFGDVTELTTASRTVTVANTGGANLRLQTVGLANPLAAPFALANDNCTAAVVAPGSNCNFDVTFTPGFVGTFPDSFDVPSNDADEPSVTVAVSGNGVAQPVPNINVTDSVPPIDDQTVPFGSLAVGGTIDQSVTVTNDGNAALLVGTATGLVAPFSLVNDTCSGQSVPPAGSCTIGVRFEPTAVGGIGGTFDIPSNDAADPTVTVSVSGTGISAATPGITVTDNTLPDDDQLVPFGNVTVDTFRDRTITVTSSGGLALLVGQVGGANPLAAPFSVQSDACSNQTLAPGGSCIVTVRFAPVGTGAVGDSLDIPSNAPADPSVIVDLTGTGIAQGDGGVTPQSPGGADSGFMAIDPVTLLLLVGAGLLAWRRRNPGA